MKRRWLPGLLLLAGCTSYQHGRPLEAVPLPAPTRDRFEVWSKGKPHQLHALRIEHDSLVGVPWWNDPACDSCRVVFARAEVDSVRGQEYDPDKTTTTAITGGIVAYLAYPAIALILFMLGNGNYD
ncbi:MAG TPA: hypothetical protein VL295_00500 [Gemmatimonadales bacterium]|nr:hypothetical protein [Gemmatimonadales bacterium]